MGDERMFPIQAQRGAAPHPTKIPWSVAELAYSVYSAEYGREQSLERLAERGGFGPGEMDMFLPDWRDRCSEVAALRKRVEELEEHRKELIELVDARTQGWREMTEKAERELAETKLEWARSVDAAAATRKALQADLDARQQKWAEAVASLNVERLKNTGLQADLDALRATSAELDADRLRKHEELHRVKADLDAALTLLGLSLREDNGLICFPGGPGSYDAQKRIRPLLEKRRVERG